MPSMESRIWDKLVSTLNPSFLEVTNESHMHAVPKGSETHFRVIVVSEQFVGLSRIQRARKVMEILTDELKGGIHAFSSREYTKEEWVARGESVPPSPPCLGGSKRK